MKPLARGPLVAIAVVAGALTYGILTLTRDAGARLPSPPWFSVVFIVLVAIWLLVRGRAVRRLVAGESTAMTPLGASRVVVAAKAAAVAGAVFVGASAALVVLGLTHVEAPAYAALLVASATALVAAVGLVVVALVVERWCTVDRDDDGDHPPGAAPV